MATIHQGLSTHSTCYVHSCAGIFIKAHLFQLLTLYGTCRLPDAASFTKLTFFKLHL